MSVELERVVAMGTLFGYGADENEAIVSCGKARELDALVDGSDGALGEVLRSRYGWR